MNTASKNKNSNLITPTTTTAATHIPAQALIESAAKKKSSAPGEAAADDDGDDDDDAKAPAGPAVKKSKIEKLFSRQNQVRISRAILLAVVVVVVVVLVVVTDCPTRTLTPCTPARTYSPNTIQRCAREKRCWRMMVMTMVMTTTRICLQSRTLSTRHHRSIKRHWLI